MAGALYARVHYYNVDETTRSIIADLGEDIVVFPPWRTEHPGTGTIVDRGTPTALFTEWGSSIQLFQAAGQWCKPSGGTIVYPYANFQHYFPNWRPVGDLTQLAMESLTSGQFLVYGKTAGEAHHIYASKQAFLEGLTHASGVIHNGGFYGQGDNSPANRGRAYLLFHTGIDETTGKMTGIEQVEFYGCTSDAFNILVHGYNYVTGADSLINFYGPMQEYQPASGDADPFGPGGTTGPGGGEGDWRIINDPIDFPALPTISVAEAGFVSIWTPELSELRRLASFMWCADPLKVDFWKQMISNPIDLILGLQLLPFDIPAEGVGRVTLGLIDSKIDMHFTDTQFHEIDCGELELAEYWGAFLDYGPFTSLDIYLPYIGVRTLNTNDCMPKTIHVKYYVDIVTGTCVAMVKCDNSLFYHFNGSCASQVPVTSGQAQQLFGQALGAAMKIAAGAATGGIAGALASTVGVASAAAQSGGTAGADRSGTISGTAGFMDTQVPYLIVTRPRQAVPEKQNTLTGYPSFITAQLGELEGYTEVQVTHLHNMSCTAAEVEEITQLLEGGVIF